MSIFNRFLEKLHYSESQPIDDGHLVNERLLQHIEQYHHLVDLQKRRQLIEVILPTKRSLQSMIIAMDVIDQTLSLDAFTPTLVAPEALIGEMITVRHYKEWEKIEVDMEVLAWNASDSSFTLALPEFIAYQPRRNFPRLTLDQSHILHSNIHPPYGAPWYSTVKDISQGGMRVAIAGDLRPHLHRDKPLPRCQIQIDDGVTLQSRGIVRAFSYVSKPYRHTEISIEFIQMSQPQQMDLKRFIDFIEVAA